MIHTVKEIMSQAQVFASAWALVGGRFDDGSGIDDAEAAKAELRRMVEAQAAEIAALRAEVERHAVRLAAVMQPYTSEALHRANFEQLLGTLGEMLYELDNEPAPSQSADAEDAARGSHIRSNMWHDAGAYAQCGHCGRYSDNPKSLLIDAWPCECGMFHGWSRSFKRPTKESKWSDAAIDAARGGES